jgi:hypothetical protein
MWEPRRLTILWASTACYRDSFIFFIEEVIVSVTTAVDLIECLAPCRVDMADSSTLTREFLEVYILTLINCEYI